MQNCFARPISRNLVVFLLLNSKHKEQAVSKNTYYRFLNEASYNWSRFLMLLAVKVASAFDRLTRCIYIDLYRYNRMYRALTDPEMLRSLSHRSIIFNNILRNLRCSLLNIIFHQNPLQYLFLHCMQGIGKNDYDSSSQLLKCPIHIQHSIPP